MHSCGEPGNPGARSLPSTALKFRLAEKRGQTRRVSGPAKLSIAVHRPIRAIAVSRSEPLWTTSWLSGDLLEVSLCPEQG